MLRRLLDWLLKWFQPEPENEDTQTCPYCKRERVGTAEAEDYGPWLVVPAKDQVLVLTCGDCAFFGGVYALLADGTPLQCAGRDGLDTCPSSTDEFVTIVRDPDDATPKQEYDA